jgi:hypothetical protein
MSDSLKLINDLEEWIRKTERFDAHEADILKMCAVGRCSSNDQTVIIKIVIELLSELESWKSEME